MWDPFREMRWLEKRMDRLMQEMGGLGSSKKMLSGQTEEAMLASGWLNPAVDLQESEKEIQITADIPGVKKEDIQLDVSEDAIEIKAETKAEKKEEKKGYVYQERRSGTFYRLLDLPAKVDATKSKAAYENGILTIKLPKTEELKKTKVEIK